MLKTLLAIALALAAPYAFAADKCDLDADGDIDRVDLNVIRGWIGQYVPPAPWEADANDSGHITINDVRACALRCTRISCVE